MRCTVVLVLSLAACGRIGFDGTSVTGDDVVTPDAPGTTFVPSSSSCTAADVGPFHEEARFPVGFGYGVWPAPSHLLAGDTTGDLRSLAFDGTTFVERDALPLGFVEGIIGDGTNYFIGVPGTGFFVVSLDPATGHLAKLAENTTTLAEARRAWYADGLLYVPAGGAGLFAFRFDGASLAQVGANAATMSFAQGAFAVGGRVMFADADWFRVLDFDGATFTETIAPDNAHGGASRVWVVGNTAFLAHASGVTAYRIDATSMTDLATFPIGDVVRDVWSDGTHVFAAAQGAGLYALSFDGSTFTELDHVDTGGQTLGVFGDGKLVYTSDQNNSLRAYSGFACTAW